MSQQQFQLGNEPLEAPAGAVEVAPGAVWVPAWMDENGQDELLAACRLWSKPPAGMRRPRRPNGVPFSSMAV